MNYTFDRSVSTLISPVIIWIYFSILHYLVFTLLNMGSYKYFIIILYQLVEMTPVEVIERHIILTDTSSDYFNRTVEKYSNQQLENIYLNITLHLLKKIFV